MPSTSVTSLLWPAGDNVSIKGEVFEAEATETRYMLRGCKPDDAACEYHTAFVNIGPWASKTLPPGAVETGVYDVHGTVDGTMYSSVCDMSRSVIEKCTVSKQSGFGESTKYTTTRTKGETGADFTLSYHPVTLTGGLKKLASAPTAITSTDASSIDETSSTNEASSAADAISGSATDIPTKIDATSSDATSKDMPSTDTPSTDTSSTDTSSTDTSSTPVPTETASAGSPPLARAFVILAVAGMAAALVVQ